MRKILLVEDNKKILHINTSALTMRGFDVIAAETLSDTERVLVMHEPDLIVLDIMLPDGNGLHFCKKLKATRNIPILFLSALGNNHDTIEGLEAGGDDYLAKPYNLEVLIARIEARLRSARKNDRFVSFGELQLDVFAHTAAFQDIDLKLTQKEFTVLHLLAVNSKNEKSISKQDLYEMAWGQPLIGDSRALWTVISRLKAKLAFCKSGLVISFSKANGYILERG